jgi:hypothetical protein
VKLNTLTVSYSDIPRLLAAIEACGVQPPRELSDVPRARDKLAAASPIVNPNEELIAAALDGRATPDKIDRALERVALARLIAAERVSLDQQIEPALLAEFGRRLESGGADSVLDLLREQFTAAADTRGAALDTLGGLPSDAAQFLNAASADQLSAYQALPPAIAVLDRIAMIAAAFGPGASFPAVPDPRSIDPGVRCPWLHATATMCTSGDLLGACAAFQRPHPYGNLPTSPWLKVSPHLHTVDSAAERVRLWAEHAWAAEEAQHDRGGRVVDGVIVKDAPRANPFRQREEATV